MTRWLYALPLLLCVGLGVYLIFGLGRDPGVLPSALVNKPAPQFTLPPLAGRQPALPLQTSDLATGKPLIVNFFASWCLPCRAEHPLVTDLAEKHGVVVHAINYKDKPADAAAWLRALGDAYTAVGADREGRVAIDFGLYGVPETYILDGQGRVRYRHAGPLTPEIVSAYGLPILKAVQ